MGKLKKDITKIISDKDGYCVGALTGDMMIRDSGSRHCFQTGTRKTQ